MAKALGFTLIELLMAMTVVAILAAISIPSYRSSVIKSNRGSAQAVLMDVAQRQQQYLLDHHSYAANLTTLGVTVPTSVSAKYTVTIPSTSSGSPPSFTATATPVTGSSQASDGAMSIDSTGAKTPASKW